MSTKRKLAAPPAPVEDNDFQTSLVASVHPGELLAEYLESYGISARSLARRLGVAVTSITNIVRKRNAVTAPMALGLEVIFGRPARMWLRLQMEHDLAAAERAREERTAKHGGRREASTLNR